MPLNSLTAFDTLAADYDQSFSRSLTGSNQRMQTRKWLTSFLDDKKELNILEINCGTGDDALWLASMGHRVVATDLSGAMISEAKRKQLLHPAQEQVCFLQCDFNDLHAQIQHEKFDLIFSNFSGLNCIPPNKINLLNQHFNGFLKPGAHIAVVIFGKYSLWEMAYHSLRLKFGKAFRRLSKNAAIMKLKDGFTQPVYYYSIRRFIRLMNQFQLIEKRPVGLFIPPSYLENLIKNRTRLFSFLNKMEERAGGTPAFSRFADHCYLLLKKKER
jgi:ubiquinone/menaquinone biosynthesis C-methylase UbiE